MMTAADPPDAPPALYAPHRSPTALSRFLLTALIGVIVDLLTKVWAFSTLVIDRTVSQNGRVEFRSHEYEFLPGWLHFKVTANYGAVFGIGQGQRLIFVVVSLAAIFFLVYLFRTSGRQRLYQFVLGMLLAGVIGNLYDRVRFGYVRDMIYMLPDRTWPGSWTVPLIGYPGPGRDIFPWIFNIADSLLCMGVGFMLVYSFFAPRDPVEKKGPRVVT